MSVLRRLVLQAVRDRARADAGRRRRPRRAGGGRREPAVWSRGVDAEVVKTGPIGAAKRFGDELLAGGDLLLLSVGRLSPEKRLDTPCSPPSRTRSLGNGLACGSRSRATGRHARELERAAPEGVVFVGELHGGGRWPIFYASADVFCFPSTTDTFGQVLLEASASELPIVAAGMAGGALELVRHGATGLLVAPYESDRVRAVRSSTSPTRSRFDAGSAPRAAPRRSSAPGPSQDRRATRPRTAGGPRRERVDRRTPAGRLHDSGKHAECLSECADGRRAASRVFSPGFAAQRGQLTPRACRFGWDALQPPPPSTEPGGRWEVFGCGPVRRGRRPAGPDVPRRALHGRGARRARRQLSVPEHVAGLLLVAPAGLPLREARRARARPFVRPPARGRRPPARGRPDERSRARCERRGRRGSPRPCSLRSLDLSVQMGNACGAAGIPTTVIGCSTDTLVTPQHCRRPQRFSAPRYRELDLPGGHVWMLDRPPVLAALLEDRPLR